MKVRIKTVEEMEKEFGSPVNKTVRFGWTEEMEENIPRDRIIELMDSPDPGEWVWLCDEDDYEFSISPDMIKEYIEIKGSDIEVYNINNFSEIYVYIPEDSLYALQFYNSREHFIDDLPRLTKNLTEIGNKRVFVIKDGVMDWWYISDLDITTKFIVKFPEEK